VSVSPVNDEYGNTVAAASIARDVTALRQARTAAGLAARNKEFEVTNQNLTSFTYSVSHDLRSPLRALAGYSGLLLEECSDDLGENGRDYARQIADSAKQMSMLIEDLLTLSRAAGATMYLQTVDLSAEIDDIARQVADPRLKVGVVETVEDGRDHRAGRAQASVAGVMLLP
jgi:light-regulated signal transduction histidine kinase (bacteriophytochrome)